MNDLLKEKVETDSSAPTMGNWKNIKSDDGFLKYLHHPEHDYRRSMALRLAAQGRSDLILMMLKSPDPRGRECGLVALLGSKKSKALDQDKLTQEMKDLVERMYTDPNESWWVKINAMYAMRRWGSELAAKHKTSLLRYLGHEDWWFQNAALDALETIAISPQHHRDVLPAMADLFGKTRISRILIFAGNFEKKLSIAPRDVQAFTMPYFKQSFDAVPREFADPTTGYVMSGGANYARNVLAGILVNLPGGVKIGRTTPKVTLKSAISGKEQDMFVFSGTYKPDKDMVGKWRQVGEVMDPATVEQAVKKHAAQKANALDQLEKKKVARAAKGLGPKLNKKGKPKKSSGPLERMIADHYLELMADGKVNDSKLLFWTDRMLVDNRIGEARSMTLKKVNGTTYLLIEKGGFLPSAIAENADRSDMGHPKEANPDDGKSTGESRPPNWHCGFHVYQKSAS